MVGTAHPTLSPLTLSLPMTNSQFSSRAQPLPPATEVSGPAGFAAPAFIQAGSSQSSGTSTVLANTVLNDPLLLGKVSDRVYELLIEDLRQQQERSCNYGGRYGK